jgi:hypothetical protein
MARASSNVSPSVTKSETGKKEISREGPPGVYPDGPIEPEFLIGGHTLNVDEPDGKCDFGGPAGIQFVTDEKGRKVAVQIDLRKNGAALQDVWDGLISESRRKDKGVPIEKIKADLIKRGRLRG